MSDVERTEAKSRALRRYEGSPLVAGCDSGEPRLDLYSPFGPLIGKARMTPEFIDGLNRHADGKVRADKGSEFTLPPETVFDGGEKSLMKVTEDLIQRYICQVDGHRPRRVTIEIFWVVSQYAGTPSPVHFHSGDISGVLYLKTPRIDREDDEERKTYISNRQAGYINFLIGGRQEFSRSLVSFKPIVGDFYIFPGWLLHGAEPFRGSGERRSLAFNARVER